MKTNHHQLSAICLLTQLVLSSVAPFLGFMPKMELVTAETTHYAENAIWIQNAAWSGFPSNKKNVLTEHLSDVIVHLRDSNISHVFVFVGYWNPSDTTIGYTMTDSQITTVINSLHSINCTVLAWAEDDGAIDVRPNNRNKLFAEITNCMNKGFDGYNDDIENYVGTLQDWIDYENNATVILHNLGKLMTADVGYDWQQNINHYLHVDYIITMFYSSRSTCEDPQGRLYWQENFGEYQGHKNPPASPVILGIMNYYGNAHPLTWQLNWIDNELSSGDGHPQLVGFSIWLYEYMSDSDWQTWDNWITQVGMNTKPNPTPPPTLTELIATAVIIVVIFSAAVVLFKRRFKKHRTSSTSDQKMKENKEEYRIPNV